MRDHFDRWLPAYILFAFPTLGILIALATGCGEAFVPICEAPVVDSTDAYIVGGTPSTDRRATARVSLAGGRYCSGTVLGPRTVLTAAHCEDPHTVDIDGVLVDVASTVTHEGYAFPQADLQMVYLDEDVAGPYATLATSLDECVGLIAQGFGQGSDGALHEREVYGFALNGLIITSDGPCFGDSGSGLYTQGQGQNEIVGVLSMGTTDDCLDGNAGFVDLLLHGDWVRDRLTP